MLYGILSTRYSRRPNCNGLLRTRNRRKAGKSFDEIGVLLPVHQFEKKMLIHLSEIDGIVLACREEMMKKAGSDSLDL